MDQLFEKMREYLKMDTEIPFDEFSSYYQELINVLNKEFNDLDINQRLNARYICSIVQSNAESREKRTKNKTEMKAYRKISQKSAFWADAINYHLLKAGMTQVEIDEKTQEINDNI